MQETFVHFDKKQFVKKKKKRKKDHLEVIFPSSWNTFFCINLSIQVKLVLEIIGPVKQHSIWT